MYIANRSVLDPIQILYKYKYLACIYKYLTHHSIVIEGCY